jgi:hypothetical protein
VLSGLVLSCRGQPANFGTLPEVSVPIEKRPAQDPTLFRDKEASALPPKNEDLPDPEPLRSQVQYDFVLEFNKGEIHVLSIEEIRLTKPQSTPRRMGRFAFELWSGAELVERVRFDFPLMGATGARDEDVLAKGLSAQTKVRVPAEVRTAFARIVDRKTREEIEIEWPPVPGEKPKRGEPGEEPVPKPAPKPTE